MEKKKRSFHKARIGVTFGVFGCFLGMVAILILLVHHLFQIQVPERLRYIKDYEDFTLSVAEVPGCNNEVYSLFQYEDQIYNGVCIWNVYANYGTVKAPLKLVLEENYITLADIRKKLGKIDEKDQTHFEYRRGEKENENYLVTISPKNYQNTSFTEVTFEKYVPKDVPEVIEDLGEETKKN